MMDEHETPPRGPGFYRVEGGELLHATEHLATPGGDYYVAQHMSYAYPIDGEWRYFESEAAALAFFEV